MNTIFQKIRGFIATHKINTWIALTAIIYAIIVIKIVTIENLGDNVFFGIYSVAVSFYILSRFVLAYLYTPEKHITDPNYQPTITFAVPAKNEGEVICQTLLHIVHVDYPADKFEIIAVNDGSDDNTLAEMKEAQRAAEERGVSLKIINWKRNRGKREGMAAAARRANNEILVFIDSDSWVDKNIAKEFVKYFIDNRVAAVAGHAYVANAEQNILTKMQSVRYFVAFKAYKAAEAVFGSVTCCSGCCSAYRREYVMRIMDEWLNQKSFGIRCTYGDDRSLTNLLLKQGYQTLFAPEATAQTFVPATLKKFAAQQLRWKKSWVRESMIAAKFMWKRNPIMSLSFYIGVALPLLSPVIVARAFIWYPLTTGQMPYFYLLGLLLMALVYGLYYQLYMKDRKWMYGFLFASLYTIVFIWQLPYAILNLRDARWGTR